MGLLNGFGGSIYKFKLAIPQQVANYQEFKNAIAENETKLIKAIKELSSEYNNNEPFAII